MSTKHFFPSTEGVVVLGLDSLVARNKHLALDAPNKVVYNRMHSRKKVTVISGGGSGHEPAWSGYVGDGMLSAAVNGDVFASPATKQIMAAINHVPSDAGIILCITNYTGDNLHFGLAREKAAGQGHKVAILRMTDDVALGRKQTENTGRRGLAANMFVLKLCGSAAEHGYDFETAYKIGYAVNDNAVTVGSSLDHCHIPGREHHRSVSEDTYVLGMGIHNEPGLFEKSPLPPVEEIVKDMLNFCLEPADKDRSFVEFKKGDVVALLINNFGGMSNFEIEALTTVTRKVLKKDWDIVPERIYASCFETSLNAPGWSISLVNFSGIERQASTPVSTLLELLDAETKAPAWPRNGYANTSIPQANGQATAESALDVAAQKGPKVDPAVIESALRRASEAAIKAEPDITRWDIQMGDGDCGEAVESMCKGILAKLDSGLAESGNLFHILDEVESAVEEVGGTLGAIISIVLASYTSNFRLMYAKNENSFEMSTKSASQAAGQALKNLMGYTSARQGGRTVMDTLIPFCETFEKTSDLLNAVEAAEKGAESTKGMKAKFGRATYLGEQGAETQQDSPPDPGAMAAAIFVRGLHDGLQKS
ncbi:Dak1-domain-containing protein [Teratosphaeria nubilosa]|uniref:Dak1-domain-containing protein n=1 Tax=Teratosphaeria nubilosa TaxID=161662 RepID=A0A6G1LDR8_9PEZI|nr:Dak1-domain-containing protein [Teratosphaeria nubilosa]